MKIFKIYLALRFMSRIKTRAPLDIVKHPQEEVDILVKTTLHSQHVFLAIDV